MILGVALLAAMLFAGAKQLLPTLEHIASNAVSIIGLILLLGLLSLGIWRVLRD